MSWFWTGLHVYNKQVSIYYIRERFIYSSLFGRLILILHVADSNMWSFHWFLYFEMPQSFCTQMLQDLSCLVFWFVSIFTGHGNYQNFYLSGTKSKITKNALRISKYPLVLHLGYRTSGIVGPFIYIIQSSLMLEYILGMLQCVNSCIVQ